MAIILATGAKTEALSLDTPVPSIGHPPTPFQNRPKSTTLLQRIITHPIVIQLPLFLIYSLISQFSIA
jgi:hypothetical protein